MILVQSPEIGNALREALALDAAGGMPLTAETTIVPVAVVADVREQLNRSIIDVSHYSQKDPATPAEYPHGVVEWLSGAAYRVNIRRMRLFSGTTQTVYYGLSATSLAGAVQGLPRRKIASLLPAPTVARAVGGSQAVFPPTLVPTLSQTAVVQANQLLQIDFTDQPFVLDRVGQAFVVAGGAANSTLYVAFEWQEDVRA